MKTIKFYTLGCKVNQYDTQSIREGFLRAGFKESSNGKPADVYLINTCTVTHKADRDSRHAILKARSHNPKARIIVTGCLATKNASDLAGLKAVDLIIGKRFFPEKISSFSGHTRAFLKIQDGCDNFCSYCKVPLVRGRSRSRNLSEIICEAKALAKNGFKEIVLCGICLGRYGKDFNPPLSLTGLIRELEKIKGLLRIRLSSIEAGDITDNLIEQMARSKKLCCHLHIPIQSGDDRVLKKMNRRYCRDDYLRLARKIKRRIPGIAITTDILVGFPGESDASFRNTLDLVKKIMPLRTHIFPYSPRQGTVAADFKHKLSPDTIKKRMKRLKDLAGECSLKYRRQFLNKKMDVLIESRSRKNPDFWQGHTGNYIKVWAASKKNLKNNVISVKLRRISGEGVLTDIC